MATAATAEPPVYGDRVVAIEPGGAEFVGLTERHGRPVHLLWTWISPNLEFATIFLGVLAVSVFGLSFWQAVAAILLGTTLGAVAHGFLSARGPVYGVPQMVLGRPAFGYWGNALPAGLMAVTAGIGWFAVNSVSGAFALNSLTGLPKPLCLLLVAGLQILIAFLGHNLVQVFERYALPVLAVAFLLASVVILAKAHPGAPGKGGGLGGFLLAASATFGYAAGWNPYASDYTRYLAPGTDRRRVGLWAGLGLFLSCTALEIVGAASVTVGAAASENPTTAFTGTLPGPIAALTLLAIALGAVAANVINIYSGALAFLAMGIRLPLALRRALVALGLGTAGLVVAYFGLRDAGVKYESFLLVISYWIAPWLAVMFTDSLLRKGSRVEHLLFDRGYRNWAGPVAMLAGMAVSILLFSNQALYVGPVPKAVPAVGDITFVIGFLVTALTYAALSRGRATAGQRSATPA